MSFTISQYQSWTLKKLNLDENRYPNLVIFQKILSLNPIVTDVSQQCKRVFQWPGISVQQQDTVFIDLSRIYQLFSHFGGFCGEVKIGRPLYQISHVIQQKCVLKVTQNVHHTSHTNTQNVHHSSHTNTLTRMKSAVTHECLHIAVIRHSFVSCIVSLS